MSGDDHQVAVPRSVTGRVAAILREIATFPGASMTQVARRVGLPASTTHRLLAELAAGHLVERSATGRYQLTDHEWSPPAVVDRPLSLRDHVTMALDDLAVVTGLRARFGVWHERGVSYLDRAPVPGARCVSGAEISTTGVLPAHATALGKALLAHAPPGELHRVLARGLPSYTDHTIVTTDDIRTALTAVRSRGIAVAYREWNDNECAVAAPVSGPRGVVAALELVGDRLPLERAGTVSVVVVAARALGRRLADDPTALPRFTGPAPLRWRRDPTQPLPHGASGLRTA